ncbi:MAG: endonuclease NucS [Asgard group archaeon]|nr:endonuclease NucS [Asgard group archaeon]
MQDYIEKNFQKLGLDIKKIIREYDNNVGSADFICYDKKNNIIIIEVKIGTANDSAVGQLLGYMKSLRESKKNSVKGILVAEEFTKRVKQAIKSDDIELIKFVPKIEFEKVEF